MRGFRHVVTVWMRRGGVGVVLLLVLALAACRASEAPAQKPAAPSAPAAPAAAQAPAAPAVPAAPAAAQPSPVARAAPAQPAAQAPAAKAARPDYGGTITFPVHDVMPSFDLHWEGSYISAQPMSPIFNGLMILDILNPGAILPDLAEKWDVAADRKSITFSLRKDVKWHDGSPFSCADAQSSLEKMLDTNVSIRFIQLEAVQSATCTDPSTLRLSLSRPDVTLLLALANTRFEMQKKEMNAAVRAQGRPQSGITKETRFLVGTGPLMFDKWTSGVDFWTKRNPNYYKKDADGNPLPYIDAVHTVIMPDLSAIFAAFRARQLTMTGVARHLEATEAEILKKRYPDAVIHLYPRNAWHNLYFNTQQKPFDDKRVRQAFAYAIDQRGTILKAVEGWGALGAYIGPHLKPFALPEEELLKHPYFGQDMEARRAKARALLKEAGIPEGFSVDFWQRVGPLYDKGAIANAADMKLVGINMNLRLVQTAQSNQISREGNFLLLSIPASTSLDDPAGYVSSLQCDLIKTGNNPTRYCNPKFDKLFEAQAQEFDPAKRAVLFHEMERILLEDMPDHRSYFWMQAMGVWDRVQGWKMGVGDQVYNFRRWETVWCKEGKCQ